MGLEALKNIKTNVRNRIAEHSHYSAGAVEFCVLMRFDNNANLLKRMEAILKTIIYDEIHIGNNQSHNFVLCAGVYVIENINEPITHLPIGYVVCIPQQEQIKDTEMIYPNAFILIFERNCFVLELDQHISGNICKIIF